MTTIGRFATGAGAYAGVISAVNVTVAITNCRADNLLSNSFCLHSSKFIVVCLLSFVADTDTSVSRADAAAAAVNTTNFAFY